MKFTVEIFWLAPGGCVKPLFEPPMPRFELPSVGMARRFAHGLIPHKNIPLHSVEILSEDGGIAERWLWTGDAWRQDNSENSTQMRGRTAGLDHRRQILEGVAFIRHLWRLASGK